MKTRNPFKLYRVVIALALIGSFSASSSANLLSNGSFEAEPAGTTVIIESTDVVDYSTFTDWRFFSVGSPPKDFSATLVTNASDGNVAMRLDMTANGAGAADHGLDRASSRIPVEYGTNYRFSFDASGIGGSSSLVLTLQEQTSNGGILASKQVSYPISNGNYQSFILEWTPSRTTTAVLYLRFAPQAPAGTSISLLLDNVQLSVVNNLTFSGLLQTYDGSAKPVSYSTNPTEGLAADITYNGLTNEPVNVGSYTVIGTINYPTHEYNTTNTLTIQTSGAYNAWKREWFTDAEQANPAISNPSVYYDSDAFSNWEEYIAGTDPADERDFPHIYPQSGPISPNEFVLNWSSVSGRVYSVSGSPDLLLPAVPLQTNLVWPQSSYTSEIIQAENFYQLNVQLPLCFQPAHPIATDHSEIIGSSHVIPRYFFGVDNCLNQGASELLAMGSKVIKIWYYNGGETPDIMYPWNSNWPTDITSLTDGLDNTHYTELFDRPFKTFAMNVASFVVPWNPYYWKSNITQAQIDQEEVEFYEFAKALLQKYSGTGKTFILQHHEGDWHTRGHTDASVPAADGVHERMVQWLNARQRGVTRAREEICAQDVFVYHAAEINIVLNSMNNGQANIVNAVLPYTDLDLVSYSCYDASINPALTGDPEALRRAVQYIKLMMPDSAAFGNDNVYLGEYGIPENDFSPSQVEIVMTNTVTIGLEENCPYIIYWQLYDNELKGDPLPIPPVTSNSDVRGFWLIKPDGTKSWHYHYLKGIIEM